MSSATATNSNGKRYCGRFAPSPTGPLHFGSLVAALASFCDARAAGGKWLVRIEDVDEPRSRAGAERDILDTLRRYGLQWDGDVIRQSDRAEAYERALNALESSGALFRCTCTRRALQQAPVGALGERVYPGTCRDCIAVQRTRLPVALRVRAPDAAITFVDQLQGPQTQNLAADVGDFVVKRADGLYAYQLAVVVDDALQEVTTIVRGADLLASTARQIHLQRLLGLSEPSYLHIPIAIHSSGEKLSKQTHAPRLPDEPLPALQLAWRFLDQPLPDVAPRTVGDFWSWAQRSWSRKRLPPVAMLPAPDVLEADRHLRSIAARRYN